MQGKALNTKTAASEPFVVMAKPTGPLCNLQCGYCYYLDTERFYQTPHPFFMSDDLLETFVRQFIEASPGPVVSFTWHGGEPTLAGLDFYKRAVELQKRYLPQGWTCWNNLQTNGILLDDEWCSFLADARFDVGLSLDGTKWLHDEYRKDHSGRGTYDRAVASVRRLQAHGVQPDLLCTVTASIANEPVAVYNALRDLNTGWIQFIPIVNKSADGQVLPESVSGEAYGNFLCTVFDEWIRRDIGRLEVQLFAEMSLVLSGGQSSLCWMAPTCGKALIVEHDGGVYSCDHYVAPSHRIGDIGISHLGILADLPEQRRFGCDKRDSLPSQCRSCAWLSLCNGGCPKDRFMQTGDGEGGLNYLCSGFKRIFSHAEQPLKQIIQLKKRGLKSEAIMAEINAEAHFMWRDIGRNDPCPCGSGRKAKNCCWSKRP